MEITFSKFAGSTKRILVWMFSSVVSNPAVSEHLWLATFDLICKLSLKTPKGRADVASMTTI